MVYCGSYAVILGFLTAQFMYRACVLARPSWTRYFADWKLSIWIGYSLFIGCLWGFVTSRLTLDERVLDYLRDEVFEVYGTNIVTVPGYAVLAYVSRRKCYQRVSQRKKSILRF